MNPHKYRAHGRKWILHPGRKTDGTKVSFRELIELYGLRESVCVTMQHVINSPKADFRGFKHLYIDESGKYELPS